MRIQLPTGKTISISVYEYLFLLEESEVALFFQSCIADDLGIEIENPFSNKGISGKLDIDDLPELDESRGENDGVDFTLDSPE